MACHTYKFSTLGTVYIVHLAYCHTSALSTNVKLGMNICIFRECNIILACCTLFANHIIRSATLLGGAFIDYPSTISKPSFSPFFLHYRFFSTPVMPSNSSNFETDVNLFRIEESRVLPTWKHIVCWLLAIQISLLTWPSRMLPSCKELGSLLIPMNSWSEVIKTNIVVRHLGLFFGAKRMRVLIVGCVVLPESKFWLNKNSEDAALRTSLNELGPISPAAQFSLSFAIAIFTRFTMRYFFGVVQAGAGDPRGFMHRHCYFTAVWMEMALRVTEDLVSEFAYSKWVPLFGGHIMPTLLSFDRSLIQSSRLAPNIW